MCIRVGWLAIFAFFVFGFGALWAQERGHIEGRVLHGDGWGIGGVRIVVEELGREAVSDTQGSYSIAGLAPGTYSVSFTFAQHVMTQSGVVVEAAGTTVLSPTVAWKVSFAESLTVTSASRRAERIVEAPAAVSTLTPEEIGRQAAHGQAPRLLAASPGVEVTQSGLYDFTVNSRGFNAGVVNNRVVVLVDGRDPYLPSVGAQEWAAIPFPLDELSQVEFVRGPGAALYGAGAFNGVLNLTTKAPRSNQGGRLRLTAGELDTRRIEGRYGGALGGEWYFKLAGGFQESDSFARDRRTDAEYEPELLPREAAQLPNAGPELAFGSLRLDRHLGANTLVLEMGTADIANTMVTTPAGRDFVSDSWRPWVRFNFNTRHWNLLGSYTARDSRDNLLSAGAPIFFDDHNFNVEWQGNHGFDAGKGRLVGGVSFGEVGADSANPQGVQTLISSKQSAERHAIFGQVEYRFSDELKGVFSGRWDESDLHESRISPRGALVYAVTPRHTLRLTYGDAFRPPNFSEFFFQLPVAAPADLSGLEEALAPLLGGVSLGFDRIPFFLLGNADLDLEEIRSFEVGYNGVLSSKAFLSLSYYKSELENFTTSPLPQLGTSLGRLNPNFGPYRPPGALSPEAATIVLGALQSSLPPELGALLSNNTDGSPIFAVLSLTTFGRVDTQGIELSLSYALNKEWLIDGSYTFFDFTVQEELLENPLVPNAPEHRYSFNLSYVGERLDAGLRYRWVDDFDWSSGVFVGPVVSYNVLDLTLNYALSDRLSLGVDVANVLDDEHYEIFGGDLLARRALLNLSVSW